MSDQKELGKKRRKQKNKEESIERLIQMGLPYKMAPTGLHAIVQVADFITGNLYVTTGTWNLVEKRRKIGNGKTFDGFFEAVKEIHEGIEVKQIKKNYTKNTISQRSRIEHLWLLKGASLPYRLSPCDTIAHHKINDIYHANLYLNTGTWYISKKGQRIEGGSGFMGFKTAVDKYHDKMCLTARRRQVCSS